jgi:hypothetical protein
MSKKAFYSFPLMAFAMLAFGSCSDDDGGNDGQKVPPVTTESIAIAVPNGGFKAAACSPVTISATVAEGRTYDITWSWNGDVAAIGASMDFIAPRAGRYEVTMNATDEAGKDTTITVNVTVSAAGDDYTPYITAVSDYRPAPGQFVNTLPEYEDGDTQETMNAKVLAAIGNNARGLVSLGGYGGYVVCGFDHTIANVPGEADFKVLGNAFYNNGTSSDGSSRLGGSCEPGIVMVAYDRNGNGLADDDEWYELAGSEYSKPTTVKGYEITYTRPTGEELADIPWTDNQGGSGSIMRNNYHRQDYYPQWIEDGELTFSGTLLPQNAVDESGTGTYWVLYAYDWGYADNRLNTEDESDLDISWAVDSDGNRVYLPGIDFVKIYTGVNQQCGWIGETSTEVMGINDLHLLNQ